MSGPAGPLGPLGRLPTVLRTVRHLRWSQALAQLDHALFGVGRPRRLGGAAPRLAVAAPATAFLPPPAHVKVLGDDRFELLATPFALPRGSAWSAAGNGPLFAYHLHQHEFLRREAVPAEARARAIGDWIENVVDGSGWDPHPTGLRLLAWGKLLITVGALPSHPIGMPDARESMLRSFADQAETLSSGLEVRLQANHLLSNLLCVVFAGLLVDSPGSAGWRARADRLCAELDRQVHPDGGHEERSPMYHAALLEGVLDVLNLCRAAPERAPRGLAAALERKAGPMLRALAILTHPDGRIALFADAAYGVAAETADLRAYARRLGVAWGGVSGDAFRGPSDGTIDAEPDAEHASPAAPGSVCLPDTGYVRLAAGDWLLLASVAGPAPAHQPGHAHGDALAFELSVAGRLLVSDPGVFEYVAGERRRRARSTASHATLQIDGEEQAEFWSAHRVGGRPEVALVAFDERGSAEATCRGWSRPRTLHRRRFRATPAGVEVEDSVVGPARVVESRLPLAPGWSVGIAAPSRAHCRSIDDPGLVVEIELPPAFDWRLESAPCHPTFGVEVDRPVLVGRAKSCIDALTRFRRLA